MSKSIISACLDVRFLPSLYWPGFGHGNSLLLGAQCVFAGSIAGDAGDVNPGSFVASGCAQVGELKARKSFKAANTAYQAQDYKKAAESYDETIAGRARDAAGAPGVLLSGQLLRQPLEAQQDAARPRTTRS